MTKDDLVSIDEGVATDPASWDSILFGLVVSGISSKLKRGEPLTREQQWLKDSAPSDYKWPSSE